MKTCETCEKHSSLLMKCAGCKVVRYCSKECQKYDWKYHRLVCKRHASAKEIVDNVRNMVLDTCDPDEKCDPWGEGKDGVDWLNNEIGMAMFFLRKISKPSNQYEYGDDSTTVADVQQKLAKMNEPISNLSIILSLISAAQANPIFLNYVNNRSKKSKNGLK